jgi:hypothetical protein
LECDNFDFMIASIPAIVCERLGFYVYVYVDPRDGEVFYVGKGQGDRALAHLSDGSESRKAQRIAAILAAGYAPQIDVLVHGLPTEEAAYRVEAAAIDLFGLSRLTNEVRGMESGRLGRMQLQELINLYAAVPVEVTHPAILVRVNRLYRYGMTPEHLYEITRGVWKLCVRRIMAKYALAIFHGVVREVFRIDSWHPAGSTHYRFRAGESLQRQGRWEFVGEIAEETVRAMHRGRSVQERYFKQGLQSPVVYVACE